MRNRRHRVKKQTEGAEDEEERTAALLKAVNDSLDARHVPSTRLSRKAFWIYDSEDKGERLRKRLEDIERKSSAEDIRTVEDLNGELNQLEHFILEARVAPSFLCFH